uniref:connectin-like n=1 Tax=Vespula vulgaris TaxID=7454 RepID=UPI0021331B69|nr:connectin-like [Vespula vulgaris]XP_050863663.1 connectin-like [Vespula vulgaris]XP_050863664.1 connectin-like [Vespula vulgaris]XP_050863665.1 connectin-like [Vespula vulgaris]
MKRTSIMSNDVLLRVFFFALLIVSTLAATTRSRGKKKVAKETKEVNICDIEGRQAPVYCYCDNNGLRNATDANCLVLNRFKVDDTMWSYFVSQIYLTKLALTVRASGTLDYIPTDVLRQLKHLKIVVFQYAKIEELAERSFSNLSSIVEINLSRNMIVVLKKHAFENVKELNVINLDDNRISEINRDVFVNLPNLRTLYLNNNNVSIVHDKAFKHLIYLEELQMSNNRITVITRESFHGLRNLKRLDLRNNLISMIGDRSFVEMPELTELELDQNSIEYISEKALDGMRNLKKLRLSENRLVSLEPDFLSGAPGIYFLDLRDNILKTMTFNNIKPIVTNLYNSTSYFYLDGNKLICDCNLAWIWGLRNETKNTKLRDALEELTCFLESNNTATSKINNDDLERNQELEIARNPDTYLADNPKNGNNEDGNSYLADIVNESYDDSGAEYEDSGLDSNSQPKMQILDGKVCYVKHLFDLKLEDLPCPETTREDLMASEQPSSRHENAPVGSSGSVWFSSSTQTHRVDRFVLASSLLVVLLLSTLIFT